MFVMRRIWAPVACLLVGISAGLGLNAVEIQANSESELPLRNLTVTIENSRHGVLFTQLRQFADKHGFAIRIAPITTSGKDFSIEMWRSDFKILGANPFDPSTFKIGVYANNAELVPEEFLDALFADLKDHLAEISTAKDPLNKP